MDRWLGKVALVTGASAGVGAAISEKLVEAGLKVSQLYLKLIRRFCKLLLKFVKMYLVVFSFSPISEQYYLFYHLYFRNAWRNFCKTLNKNTPIKDMWNQAKRLQNIFKPQVNPVTEGEWVEEFLRKLCPDNIFSKINVMERKNSMHPLSIPFSFCELEISLKNKKNTSPGIDNVHYIMLANLHQKGKETLLNFFNQIWLSEDIPDNWREYRVIPILKTNRNPDSAESYRGISLSSCITKTLERMIKLRLESWLEKNNKLSQTQFGFRKNHSTVEAVSHLVTDINLAFTKNSSVIALLLDVEAAYDNVNLNILYNKMIQIGLPECFCQKIIKLYDCRKIYISVNNNTFGPRVAMGGLPQGGILSPLLYLIYTSDIEKNLNSTKILQFADDIVIYQENIKIENAVKSIEEGDKHIKIWSELHGLNISDSKTKLCIFTRKRKEIPNHILINNISYPVQSYVKYLGITLDRQLLWKEHIDNIVKKTEKGINLLRFVSHLRWGADPNISLLLFKNNIRAIFDYGSILYSDASQCHLNKIDKIINKSLRLCIGALRSTPINNLQVECCEMPMDIRRKKLGINLLVRLYEKKASLISKIHQLFLADLTEKYWIKKKTLNMVDLYSKMTIYDKQLYKYDINPNYNIDFNSMEQVQVYFLRDYSKLPISLRKLVFISDSSQMFKDYCMLYTDASKNIEGVGCAYWDSSNKISKMFKLNSIMSIYTAELIAIMEALKYLSNINHSKFIIFSDSKSSLSKISAINPKSKVNYIELYIINKIKELQQQGKSVKLAWVKSHCGITGNEMVDELAKNAVTQGVLTHYLCTPKDIESNLFKEIKKEWKERYIDENVNTGNHYRSIRNYITDKPWFSKMESTKDMIRTICRMRFDHCLTPSYLFKINIADSPQCICGQLGNLQHKILTCSLISNKVNMFLNSLYSLTDVHHPINLNYLLTLENNELVYRLLYKHILDIKLKL